MDPSRELSPARLGCGTPFAPNVGQPLSPAVVVTETANASVSAPSHATRPVGRLYQRLPRTATFRTCYNPRTLGGLPEGYTAVNISRSDRGSGSSMLQRALRRSLRRS
jgi:hypothetical protein